ncbi:hypothetical protein ACFV1W_39050 [Kitasatospora sp. NPDC059648]|uniref:hypothetical protein n=1 Tax=Kitasatospora sp. NPDC059648 TaxID=3346894 RepID=UPI0036A9B8B8
MTIAKRLAAVAVPAFAALSLGGVPAFAIEHVRHLDPPVTVLQCEEGGGFVAADIRTRREFCVGGEFNDHYVTWE